MKKIISLIFILASSLTLKAQVISFQSDSLFISLKFFGKQKIKCRITVVNNKLIPIYLSGSNSILNKAVVKVKNAIGVVVAPGAFTGNIIEFSVPLVKINPGDTLRDAYFNLIDYFTNEPIRRVSTKVSIDLSYLKVSEIESDTVQQNMISGKVFLDKRRKLYCDVTIQCKRSFHLIPPAGANL